MCKRYLIYKLKINKYNKNAKKMLENVKKGKKLKVIKCRQ
jgi:hypothetical protein